MAETDKEQKEQLLTLVREALRKDDELRKTYQVGDKFRFVRDRLQALQLRLEQSLALDKPAEETKGKIAEDEVVVYVHLFNAQGIKFPTWQKMLTPSVFYEYSVNRPIYTEKAGIEAFIRQKVNKAQHGFLTIVVKKSSILKANPENPLTDAVGQPLIKVKEGSLRFENFVSFTHNDHEYVLNKAGELINRSA